MTKKWCSFINEKSVNSETGDKSYSHQRLHLAVVSIKSYMPYLFTYQHIENMPNTKRV